MGDPKATFASDPYWVLGSHVNGYAGLAGSRGSIESCLTNTRLTLLIPVVPPPGDE